MSEQKIIIQAKPLAVRPKKAAQMLDIGITQMSKLIETRQVKASQPGGPNTAVFILVESLEAYLQKGMVNVA